MTYKGTTGVVIVEYDDWSPGGPEQQLEVTSFTVTESLAIINDNANADEWDTHLLGRNNFSGTIASNYDFSAKSYDLLDRIPELDGPTTTQIGIEYLGKRVNLTLYPQGDINALTENTRIVINGTVTAVEQSNNHDNTVLSVTLTFTGSGMATDTVV